MDKKENLLIDSDVLINFYDEAKKFHLKSENAFYDIEKRNYNRCISIVTTIEMIQGSKNNIEKNRIIKNLEAFFSIPISEKICDRAKDLIITYSSSHGLLMGDAFIAATALYLDIQLFTFNKKDFRFIENLKLYEP